MVNGIMSDESLETNIPYHPPLPPFKYIYHRITYQYLTEFDASSY